MFLIVTIFLMETNHDVPLVPPARHKFHLATRCRAGQLLSAVSPSHAITTTSLLCLAKDAASPVRKVTSVMQPTLITVSTWSNAMFNSFFDFSSPVHR